MAKRPNLAAVDLKDTNTGRPAAPSRNSKAQTLRLPADYWRRLRIAAAVLETTQIALVQQALDDWFKANKHKLSIDLNLDG